MSSKKKPTPEEAGKNLEEFAFWSELEEEAKSLGTKTKREVQASIHLSPETAERARELGRMAKEAFEKAAAEERARAKPADSQGATTGSNVTRLDERRRKRGRSPT